MKISGRIKDLKGMIFGRLYVVELDYLNPKQKNASYWKCKCSCGGIVTVRGVSLTYGDTKSCGCFQKEMASEIIKKEIIRRTLPLGTSARNDLYRQYKKNAKKRGFEFDIKYEYFIELTSDNCYYCGSSPSNKHSNPHWNGFYLCNGIDRVDNSKGYVVGNVVTCCKRCNVSKSDLSEKEFLCLISKIYHHKKLKK